jgi:hypothetical protein
MSDPVRERFEIILAHLHRTLQDFSSAERQLAYKRSVPFVHVPVELLEQWEGFARQLRNLPWLRSLFTPDQAKALDAFDAIIRTTVRPNTRLPDVPEVLSVEAWQSLMSAAGELVSLLPQSPVDSERAK